MTIDIDTKAQALIDLMTKHAATPGSNLDIVTDFAAQFGLEPVTHTVITTTLEAIPAAV
jgi:hypothetical protein